MVEQPPLAWKATRKAGQATAAPQHPVARDHDGDGVATHRSAHGPGAPGATDGPGQRPIGLRVSMGNLLECRPHGLLEGGAREGNRQRKPGSVSGQPLGELFRRCIEDGVRTIGCRDARRRRVFGKGDGQKRVRPTHQPQRSQWRVHAPTPHCVSNPCAVAHKIDESEVPTPASCGKEGARPVRPRTRPTARRRQG